ncbi:hypothetical protein Tco_0037780 [Tanacetum coccineum]
MSKFMSESAKRHEENSNMIKEIRALMDVVIRNQRASIKTLEIQIGQMSKVLQEKGFRSLPSSTESNSRDQVKSILTTIEVDSYPIRRMGSSQYAVSTGQNCTLKYETKQTTVLFLSRLNSYYYEEKKGSYGPQFLKAYSEASHINNSIPRKLRRDQGDDLMPTIEEGEVIEKFKSRDDELDTGINDYPSYSDYDKKIRIDCAHNLKFSCMIGFEFIHVNFFLILYVNVMSKKFHNSIMKDKMVYKRINVVGALMSVPIFVGTFSVMMDFTVLEDMDAYRDEGMGDVIFGEPFLREIGIKARRFDGIITI